MGVPSDPYCLAKFVIRTGDGRTEQLLNWYAGFGSSGDPVTDLAAFVGGTSTDYAALIKPCLTTGTRYLGMLASFHQDGVTYTDSSTNGNGVGDEATDELPEFVAACVQKKTAFPGRSGSGRWFFGGVPESLTDEGRLSPAGEGKYEAVANYLKAVTGVGACDLSPAVFSNMHSDLYVITSIHVDTVLARQSRRRLRSPI